MTHEEMERLTAHTDIKSEKIRVLFRTGVQRADIARFMGVQYQYVQNILKRSGLLDRPQPGGDQESEDVKVYTVKVTTGGAIRLPREYTKEHGINAGDTLICREGKDGLTIMSRSTAAETLRKTLEQRMPAEAALLEALLDRTGSS
ncbi:AbrB/MazE/SpoVT family DNA-binding domain-containing protein [Tsuneonella sp. SYSU-LHT278]|uniref:AbrB/MazE/SpoVT family DNA-binding domain-containing protein n=1 Tax=Tsuneonella sediminis TaxID=3416089 RepID=UPI003F79E69C